MTTFNHALGAQARRRNFVLLGALVVALALRGSAALRHLLRRPAAGRSQAGGNTRGWRGLAARRAAEAAYWVDTSLRPWPRGTAMNHPDPA